MTAPGLVSFGDFWGGAEDACPCFLECYPAAALHWVGSKSVYLHRPGDASGRAMKGRSLRALLWTFELVESANARGHQQDDVDVAPHHTQILAHEISLPLRPMFLLMVAGNQMRGWMFVAIPVPGRFSPGSGQDSRSKNVGAWPDEV